MSQNTMYNAINNSPITTLVTDITASDKDIDVVDTSAFPAAPNIATIGDDEEAELILYAGKTGTTLTNCTRGFNGTTPQSFEAGTKVYRAFTAYDHNTFVANIRDLVNRVQSTDAKTAEAVKYTEAQTLTEAQKVQSRTNIGAASEGDLSDVKSALKMVADGGENIDITGYNSITCVVSSDNTLTRASNKYKSYQFAPDALWESIEITANPNYQTHVTFVTEALPTTPGTGTDITSLLCHGETGRHIIAKSETDKFVIPSDCADIVIAYTSNSNNVTPQNVTVYPVIGMEISKLKNEMDSKMDKMLDRKFDWSEFASDNYPLGWQKGYYSASNGGTATDNDNIRTIRGNAYIANKGDVLFTLSAPAGYHAQICEYDASGSWQRTIGHHETGGNIATAELTEGYLYRFCIGGFDGDAEDYITDEFISTVTGTISKDFISWQQEQDDRITALEAGESEIPDYYTKDGWLQGRLDEITTVQNAIGTHQDSFWLISDFHHQYNKGKSIPLLKHLAKKTGINKIFFAGDAGGASGTSDVSRYRRLQLSANAWEDMASCADYFFGVLGNHEWINTETITQAGVMGAFLNRYKVSYEVDADTGNYIVNNNANKIRYYFIQDTNAAYPVSGTLGWLYNDLMTLPDGWSVALFMHYAWVSPTYFEYECDGATIEYNRPIVSFMTTMLQGFRDHTTVTYSNVDYDFSGRTETNYVIGIFSGHLHHGLMFAADNEYNTRKVLTFMASTDCMHASSVAVDGAPWYWENGIVDGTKVVRESETVTEQCFYAVQIDLDAKKVYITAVGGDHDYEEYYEEPEA